LIPVVSDNAAILLLVAERICNLTAHPFFVGIRGFMRIFGPISRLALD
jgi:hypothetical protein